MEDKNPIQVAGRPFGAMEYLADHGSASLMDLANELDLNKSTAHRILSSLQYMGYVRQEEDGGKYLLTLKLVDLANRIMDTMDIVSEVRPYLRNLAMKSGETVHFVHREGIEAVYIDKTESYEDSVQMISRIGSRIPLYCSGVGKAIAASMDDTQVRQLWEKSKVEKRTPKTITDFNAFQDTLSEIRRTGYALDNEENELGVRCVATALALQGQQADYAFSISAPIGRMDDERIEQLATLLLETKNEILNHRMRTEKKG